MTSCSWTCPSLPASLPPREITQVPSLLLPRFVVTLKEVVRRGEATRFSGDTSPKTRSRGGAPVLSALGPLWDRQGLWGRAPALAGCFQFEFGFCFWFLPHVVLTAAVQTKNKQALLRGGELPAPPGTFICSQCAPRGRGAVPPFPIQYIHGALRGNVVLF